MGMDLAWLRNCKLNVSTFVFAHQRYANVHIQVSVVYCCHKTVLHNIVNLVIHWVAVLQCRTNSKLTGQAQNKFPKWSAAVARSAPHVNNRCVSYTSRWEDTNAPNIGGFIIWNRERERERERESWNGTSRDVGRVAARTGDKWGGGYFRSEALEPSSREWTIPGHEHKQGRDSLYTSNRAFSILSWTKVLTSYIYLQNCGCLTYALLRWYVWRMVFPNFGSDHLNHRAGIY